MYIAVEPTISFSLFRFHLFIVFHVREPGRFRGGFLAGGPPRGALGGLRHGAVYNAPPDVAETKIS